MKNLTKLSTLLFVFLLLTISGMAQDFPQDMISIEGNAIIAGNPEANPALGGNANGIINLGWPAFPGCVGHYGRFCRLTNGVPNGSYDLIQYLNAEFDGERFTQIDPEYDVWIGGICIANDPKLTGYDISYAPAGKKGEIKPMSRLKIDGKGQVGICSSRPEATLDIQNEDTKTATIRLGLTPNNISSCRRIWCPGNSDYVWDYTNARFDVNNNRWFAVNPEFGSFRRQICAGPNGFTNFLMGPAVPGSDVLDWIPSLSINELGTVGINTDKPNRELQLEVNGILGAIDVVQLSDKRFKKNIVSLEGSLDKVMQLNGVEYEYRKGEFKDKPFKEGTQLGFIAQEVNAVYPEVVKGDADGFLSVSYPSLIPALTNAIQELKSINDAIQDENESLKAQLQTMQTEVTAIQMAIAKLTEKPDLPDAKASQ